jgi:protease-4
MIPNLQKLLEDRIGITYDSAYTSPAAEGLSTFSPMSSDERNYIMKGVDRVYNTFTSHVAEGRNLDIDYVLTIAEGRVWSGDMAKEIGLVDEIGGLSKAIAKAVELADIGDNYKLYEYVAPLTPFEEWLDSMGMFYANTWGLDYNIYGEQIRSIIMDLSMITSMEGIRAEVVGDLRVEF